jgi:erythromycin esterase-like protein
MALPAEVQQVVDYLKANPADAQKVKDYVKAHPADSKAAVQQIAAAMGWDLSKVDPAVLEKALASLQ